GARPRSILAQPTAGSQHLAGPAGVPANLLSQGINVRKFANIPQAVDELDGELPAVEVAVEIEQVNFEQARSAGLERGTPTQVRDAPGDPAVPAGAHGVDPVARPQHLPR